MNYRKCAAWLISLAMILSPLQTSVLAAEAGEETSTVSVSGESTESTGDNLEIGSEELTEVISPNESVDSGSDDTSSGAETDEIIEDSNDSADADESQDIGTIGVSEDMETDEDRNTVDLTGNETEQTVSESEEVTVNAPEEGAGDSYPEGMTLNATVSATAADRGESDNEELFAQYVDNLFYPKPAAGRGKLKAPRNMGSRFSGGAGVLYTSMRELAQQIAAGQESSSILEIPVEDLGFGDISWSAEELGVEAIVVDEEISDAALDRTFDLFEEEVRKSEVFAALRVDCPYELYWYDKTQGISTTVGISAKYQNGEWRCCVAGNYQISVSVAGEYALDEYVVDTEKTGAATIAVENAGNIIDSCAGLTDAEKIYAYISEICDMVSYNDDAADNDVPYGNPWQLIWVFDGDESTNVVCEGYSKAFQYLCDRSDFNADICCYSVSGLMGGGTGEGRHMWNIIRMDDGYHYHIDVTNSDDGTVGQDGELIMQPPVSGSVEEGYIFDCGSTDITYGYDEDTRKIYSADELTIAEWKYGEKPVQPIAILLQPEDVEAYSGDTVTFRIEAEGEDLSYQWQYSWNGTTWSNCSSRGADTPEFTFTMRDSFGKRLYRCSVSNENETVFSDAAHLTLKKVFAINTQPEDGVYDVGDAVLLNIEASGDDLQYQWQYSYNNGKTWNNCTSKGYNTPAFSFLMKESLAGRKYRCIVTSGDSSLISDAASVELFRPELAILTHPAGVTLSEGDKVNLQIEVNRDDVTYQWQFSNNNGKSWTNCTSKGYNTSSFSFLMKESLSGRKYRCIVTSGDDSLVSEEALIEIPQPDLAIQMHPVDVEVMEGEKVNLHVEANRSDAAYQWQYSKNGTTWTNCTSKGYNTDTFSFLMKASLSGRYYRCTVTAGTTTVISDAAYISMK